MKKGGKEKGANKIVLISVAPEISVPSQLYGVGPATDVTVSCRVQAYPSAINYWVKDQVKYTLTSLFIRYRVILLL